jgi:nucleoside-diphosphate kinase
MSKKRTIVLFKPDSIGIWGEILTFLEKEDLAVIGAKTVMLDRSFLKKWYCHLVDKPFFSSELVPYMTSGLILALVIEGEEAIERVRQLVGPTDPKDCVSNQIRSHGKDRMRNLIHCSDSMKSFFREYNLLRSLKTPVIF